jgi:hypothetical protein
MSDEKPEEKKDPTDRQTGKEEKYAYTITDKSFGEFKVLNSANAWWLDQLKVRDLIAAYKIDSTDEEACAYAGVSLEQLRYFKTLHPDFSLVKHACKQLPMLKARKTLNDSLDQPVHAQWFLERKRKAEFSKREETVTYTGEKTLEDLLDDFKNETTPEQQNTDSKIVQDQNKEGPASTVPAERSAELLLAEKNPQKPDLESPAKGDK